MRRLIVLGMGLVAVTCATAMPPTRILTFPSTPATEALDRLNLAMAWKQRLPMDGRHDGIGLIQHLGEQYFVQLRDGTIFALDAATGAVQWARRVGNRFPVVRPLGNHKDLVLALDTYRIIALDKATGVQRWVIDAPEVPIAPPQASPDILFVPLSRGRLLTYQMPESIQRDIAKENRDKPSTRARVDMIIQKAKLIASDQTVRTASAVDPRSARGDSYGRTAAPTEYQSRAQGSDLLIRRGAIGSKDLEPAQVEAGRGTKPLYLTTQSPGFTIDHPVTLSNVGALITGNEAETLLLRRDVENPVLKFTATSPLAQPPTQFGQIAYFAGVDGAIQAVDLIGGMVRWQSALPAVATQKLVATELDLFAVTDRPGLIRLDRATGQMTWNQTEARTLLAVNKSYVYANDRLGTLMVLDRATGTPLTRIDLSGYNVPMVNFRDDRILLSANDGAIICLRDRGLVSPLVHEAAKTAKSKAEAKSDEKAGVTPPGAPK